MHILCVGLNHDTTPVHIRERFAFDAAAKLTLQNKENHDLTGLILLSTCSRVELYAISNARDFAPLENLLSQNSDIGTDALAPHLYRHADESAALHLMRVAAGLDSVVLGEPQILGQIARTLKSAQDEGNAGLLLTRLFQQAIHAGKRVRNETAIGRNPTSIAGVAVRLAGENLPNFSAMHVTVLGAGKTASLVVGALRYRGVENLQVLNRTLRRAQELACFWGGHARPLSDLPAALQSSDLVISSAQAHQPIVQTAAVAEAMQFRPQRPLTLIDVAVPRNVEPETAGIPNVFLHNMDTLQKYLARSVGLRQREQPQVEKILAQELDEFREYLRTYKVLPLIAALYEQAEAIRKSELEKTLRHISHLSGAEQKKVNAMTRAIIKKLLHTPAASLRIASGTGRAAEYAASICELFDLNISAK